MANKIAELVFALPFDNKFSYLVPSELEELTKVGVRAVAPLGKRILTGYIVNIVEVSEENKINRELKYLEDILDVKPVFSEKLIDFCKWVADYYFCSLGEVFKAAIPYGSDVESKRIVVVDNENILAEMERIQQKESNYYKLLTILTDKSEYTINEITKKYLGSNLNYNLRKLENAGLCSIFIETPKPKVSIKTENVIELTESCILDFNSIVTLLEKKAPKQVNILFLLYSTKEKKMPQKVLLEKANANTSILNQLEKKGYIKIEKVEVKREYKEIYHEEKKQITLNEEQQKAYDIISKSIDEEKFKAYLLYGVTASGKTQVYLELIKRVLQKGKTALYLVPEIALTPQIITRVRNFFGQRVGVLHSRLSLGEKYDQWRGIINKEYDIVIGPRSALFSPLENIGIIIVDEEHEASYKQNDMVPYYNARDAAIMRAVKENATIILGSATPSIESYYNALQGKLTLIEIKNRVDNAILPDVVCVNIKKQLEEGNVFGSYTKILLDKIKEKFEKKEKTIILQNRRGFATYIICPDCGYTETCKNCTVTLTYHLYQKQYVCHYCGYTKKEYQACPMCGSFNLRYKGIGTQRAEDELEALIPDIKIGRMDLDTTSKKGTFGKLLNDFKEGNINVLLGTQMVAKGLDFPDVTLVGVISAEASLNFPDFRAPERTFQILTQVSGRAGRNTLKGEVVIQTFNPDHYVLQFVKNNDYSGFYNTEIEIRKNALYPPFVKLALIEISGKNLKKVKQVATDFVKTLKFDYNIIQVLGPAQASIFRLNQRYRYHILIKSRRNFDPNGSYLHKVIKLGMSEFSKKFKPGSVKILIDIDPIETS